MSPLATSSADRCQRPWYCTRASGIDLALAAPRSPGLRYGKRTITCLLERGAQRLERGVAHPHPRRVAEHRLVGGRPRATAA